MPPFLGIKVFREINIAEIVPLINWKMYFTAWDLQASLYTEEHRKLEEDSRIILKEIVERKLLKANAVAGFFEVRRKEDSLTVLTSGATESLHFLRQQTAQEGKPFLSIADFFNPREIDYIGLFAATAGIGADELANEFREKNDDYSAFIVRLLADRLAEALTEKLHRDILGGVGIRAAPGYPACPDHTEKATIWKLLEPEKNAGIFLSENYAMIPVASECGYFILHPQSNYFKIGKIGEDQLQDYAKRKGMNAEELRKWIA
ncbi:hypothetical protein AGMMS49938_14750 [Fibrobacterales bacterium]|nr:hypothetical protein AGMMS49938_14610 [Fibrobacterales bacterium]GHV15733.1 hypothetical protein AGMMS49938_14750 [Fibrobacterales bacterium]